MMSRTNRVLSSGDFYTFGTGKPVRGIVACLHGNEPCGLVVPQLLKNLKIKGTVKFVIGNPLALEQNIRFVNQDLNSSFPGSKQGKYEERRAKEILQFLEGCDEVLDLHSTSRSPEPFGVSVGRASSVKLAQRLGLQRLVVMPSGLKRGHSLLDHLPESVSSLSVECGTHDSPTVVGVARAVVSRFIQVGGKQQSQGLLEIYRVKEILKLPKGTVPNPEIVDFECVKIGKPLATRGNMTVLHAESPFYPVLFGEEAYVQQGVLGLAAKRGCLEIFRK